MKPHQARPQSARLRSEELPWRIIDAKGRLHSLKRQAKPTR
jgi:hypothetical protein